MYITRAHIRDYGAAEACPGCKGIKTGKSMPHSNECRMRIRSRMEQSEDSRERLKKEEQRQDRHLEKAVMRRVEKDQNSGAPRRSTSGSLWRLRTMMVQQGPRQKDK